MTVGWSKMAIFIALFLSRYIFRIFRDKTKKFLYCSSIVVCIALLQTHAIQHCNISFLQLAENLQSIKSLSGNMLMSKIVAANQRSVLRAHEHDHMIRK